MLPEAQDEIELPLEPIREKLANVYLPNARGMSYTHDFANYLSTRLRGEAITPTRFLFEMHHAFGRLRRGTENNGSAILHDAVDRVPTVEMWVRMDIPALIDAVFPADFAAQAKAIWKTTLDEAENT
jgi:hypothetical protein